MEKFKEINNHFQNSFSSNLNESSTIKITPIVTDEKPGDKDAKINHLPNKAIKMNLLNGDYDSCGDKSFYNHSRYNSAMSDLIPYPSSSISTIIEKGDNVNWNNYNSNKPVVFKNNKTKKKPPVDSNIEYPSSSQINSDSVSETASQVSKCEVDSHFHNTDITRIVKFLKEKKEKCTQTESSLKANQYVQVNISSNPDDPSIFELQRSNQALRSQIEQLSFVVEEMSKERSSSNLQMHYLQKQTNVKELKIEEINAEKEKLLADNDELRFAIKNFENYIMDYKKELSACKLDNENTKQYLNDLIQERNCMILQLEELKQKLFYKDTILIELDSANVCNKQDISNLNHQIVSLNSELNNAKQEVDHLRQNQGSGTRLENANFYLLKQKFSNLKEDLKVLKKDCIENVDFITKSFENINDLCENVKFDYSTLKDSHDPNHSLINQLRLDVENLQKLNDKLVEDKIREKDNNIELNLQFQSRLNNIQVENEDLKISKQNLECQIDSLRSHQKRKETEYQNILSKSDEYRVLIDKLKDELNTKDLAQSDELSKLKTENSELKEVISKLEENADLLQKKLEEFTNQYKTTDKLQIQFKQLNEQFETCSSDKLLLESELNKLKAELNTRQEVIVNLEYNIQTLTNKYNELQNKSVEINAEDSSMQKSIEEMRNCLIEKDTLIQNQNVQLNEMNCQLGQIDSLKKQLEDKVLFLEQTIQAKDVQLANRADSAESELHYNQKIVELENSLLKEKERSKGMSQLLFNEKRANCKLKTKFNDCMKSQQVCNEDADVVQLKSELVERINQLKELISKYNPSMLDSSTKSILTSPDSSDQSSFNENFIVQILEQSEQLCQNQSK